MDLILLSIPIFFALMGAEWLAGRVRRQPIFRGPDVFANLALGTAQTVFTAVAAGFLASGYLALYDYRLWDVPESSVGAWIALLFGLDFLYYWFHRASHRINLAWAAHAPHHQSEDYNLAVALRQGPVQPVISRIFMLPLAWLGFSPTVFATMLSINTLYQFWIHTELIGKLGPLEWVLNTPSHHRVHHGCTGQYLDKNHAGIFIIWDRMFGSFAVEQERPTYGTVKPINTFNPLMAAIAPFRELFALARRAPRFVDKLKIWVMPPEWRPRGIDDANVEVLAGRPKFEFAPSRGASVYVTVSSVLTLAVSLSFLFTMSSLSTSLTLAFAAWFAVSLAGLGGALEGKRWAPWVEATRLAATPLLLLPLL